MKNSKTKEQLLAYAIKMRLRGENFKNIDRYLSMHSENEEMKRNILEEINQNLELKDVELIKPKRKKTFNILRLRIYAIVLIAFLIFYYTQTHNSFSFIGIGILSLFVFFSFYNKKN